MSIRTFIALEIPEEPINKILQIKNGVLGESFRAKWEPKEKLHITLKFLGDSTGEIVNSTMNLLDNITREIHRFELTVDKFGVFIKNNDPKIFWIGMKPNRDLSDFSNRLNRECANFGFEMEKREFKPHITLLRFRGYEDSEKVLSLTKVILPEIKFYADKVIYFESKLLPSGSVYNPIKSFYLKN